LTGGAFVFAAPSVAMRVAAIDLGTNTVRLLVAEVRPHPPGWRTVLAEQRVTRLGEGFRTTGALGEAAAARTASTVIDYVARARSAGATRVVIAATSAARDASNGRVFVRHLEEATGIGVRIISGEDEARLTLAGIVAGLGRLPGSIVAFDIGGGSTEYMLARDGALGIAVSLRLGVVPLAERFPFPNAVEPARYRELRAAVQAQLVRELPPTIAAARIDTLVGTAGTVTTLAALDLGLAEYDPARVQGHVLTRAAIERQRRRLNALDVAGRAALPCLEPGRADLIVGGVAIVEATLDRLGVEGLTVSDWSLREGLVAELAARQV
jgi:exopolyphosphatase / guanosine-5'-triphosphate,3'-diphosphate pyrophosphatase